MPLFKKYEKIITQFLKYIIVGGTAFVFDFFSLFTLTEFFGIHYLTSATIAFIIGLNVNYILAKYFVFTDSKIKNIRAEYFFVVCISLSGLILNIGLLWLLTEKFLIYYLISKLIATIITLFYNFWIRKVFVFN
jgi:putative flippase GtrA